MSYTVNGTVFNDIFEPLNGGTKRADVGYQINGIDISNLYYPSDGDGSPNSDQITYNTNFKYKGTDLRYYFKAKSIYIGYVAPFAGVELFP